LKGPPEYNEPDRRWKQNWLLEGDMNRKSLWAAFTVVLAVSLVTRAIFHITGLLFAGPASTVTAVLAIWLLWRGGLLETRFVGLAWPDSKKKSALIFISAFAVGALVAGFIGVEFGILYYLGGRKLWPLIIAHAIPDTISIVSIYSGK